MLAGVAAGATTSVRTGGRGPRHGPIATGMLIRVDVNAMNPADRMETGTKQALMM